MLDWYHIKHVYSKGKIALPYYSEKLNSSKDKVLHGKSQEAIIKLDELTKELDFSRVYEKKLIKHS